MRISCAMYFRISETMMLEQTSTNVVASPMARLLATAFVTASAEQSPSVCTSTGFSCQSPRVSTAPALVGAGDDDALIMLMRASSPSDDARELRAREVPRQLAQDLVLAQAEQRGRRGVGP